MSTTYNTRTLQACAKRLRHVLTKTPQAKWQVVWRFREGFRLQIEGEHHEPTGWITHGNVLTIGDVKELEWDTKENRANDIAADALGYTVEYRPQDLNDEQLRFLAQQIDYLQIAELAQTVLRDRTTKRMREAC